MTPVLGIANAKSGDGATSLTYHLAHMFADLGASVLAADLDPQGDLTINSLFPDALETMWTNRRSALFTAIDAALSGSSAPLPTIELASKLHLIPADLRLCRLERVLADTKDARRALSEVIRSAALAHDADVVLIDIAPNLTALNRAVLAVCTHIIVPLAPDCFAIEGMSVLGDDLAAWQHSKPDCIGYVVQYHQIRLTRPMYDYARWINAIPSAYRGSMLRSRLNGNMSMDDDPECLGSLRHYVTLAETAFEVRKPMFHLTFADGAVGSQLLAARDIRTEFAGVARRAAERAGVRLPSSD